ncbi:Gfo/Idh/MocA family protein [Parapedobacter indicus]|uniref:Predicted dehydrogenase n=1 Tax=Parapedobacter indicus TaxID=1477437 RepID=A0A1I3H452_9SPHI|nr:Gfo/Idh/MocA family oxidoreductase [Parapedobacter indicus]PPL02890.1 putative dehydrogenase [Parapedobacter indicus]SFI30433.1 Predicted dehydrogenase [Parapedobacter indicus]
MDRRSFLKQSATLSGIAIVPRFVLGGKGFLAPSDRLTLGFIGTGRQALTLQKNFTATERIKIVGAADVYRSKLEHFVRQLSAYSDQSSANCRKYDDFRELLNNGSIDAVVISAPDHWHGVMATLAADAKKDIYCEKPLALTIQESRAIVKAAARNQVVFQTGSMQRSAEEFRKAVNVIRNGYLGEITQVRVNIGGPPVPFDLPEEKLPADLNWEMWLGPNDEVPYNHELAPVIGDPMWARWRYYIGLGGGDMTDWGAHMFDIVQWALDMDGKGPVSITPPDGKDTSVLTYRYDNGVVMTQSDAEKGRFIVFEGTEGQLRVQRRLLETNPKKLKDTIIDAASEKVYHSENHYIDFLDAIRSRKQPICPAEVGHRTNTVCLIGNIAYQLGRSLRWDYVNECFVDDEEANAKLGRRLRRPWII